MAGAAVALVVLAVLVVCALVFVRWGTRWGATAEERAMKMSGDEWLRDRKAMRVVMTRAISVAKPPDTVWPWLAQLGRGAGWYSIERLDNGGRTSARHLVSWIPAPRLGDATAIGYLRHLDVGTACAWWVPEERFLGASTRMVFSVRLRPAGDGSRLVARVSADAVGLGALAAVCVFPVIDSIMARAQLLGIRDRAEGSGAASSPPQDPETGARDQYQLYEVIYASGDTAGVKGKENASLWRAAALQAGLMDDRGGTQESA